MRSLLLQPVTSSRLPLSKRAMARGVLVVAENLGALIPYLEAKRFRVVSVTPGMKDDQIALTLSHRIFVTNNAADFLEAASVEEFSIIDTSAYFQDLPVLATEISRTWRELELKGKQPFLLKLNRNGRPSLTEIQ